MGRRNKKRHNEVLERIRELEKRLERRKYRRNHHNNTEDEYETRSSGTRSRSQSTYTRSRSSLERSRSPPKRSPRRSSRRSGTPHRHISSSPVTVSPTPRQDAENKGGAEAATEPPTEKENSLPASIEGLLGEEGVPIVPVPVDLHESLAKRWAAILQSGLSAEVKSAIIKKQSPPSNCSLLIPPKLNEEVAAAMNESGIKRDKRIGEQQFVLAAVIATIGKVLNHLITTKDEQHIEALSDSSRLLCDLYHDNSITRRSLILPGLNKDMKELMEQTPISEYLFGDKLQDKVNAVKAVKKSGQELKNTPAQNKQPAKATRGTLNYRGPQRPQAHRLSGPKVKPKRPTYPVPKPQTRSRRSPPRQHYRHRRQDHHRR